MDRVCKKCNQQKELNEVNFKKQRNKNLFQNVCRECQFIRIKELRDSDPSYKEKRKKYYKKRKYNYKKKEKNVIYTNFVFKSVGPYIKERVNCRYLDYTIQELISHLESKFESWMNWDNWGKYSARKWDDNDISTWRWQIDHIIPISDLPYTSPYDDNFKKCWALENLRPLSAKTNVIEGANRARHSGKKNYIIIKRKEEYPESLIYNIKNLKSQGFGTRKISSILNISREKINKISEKLNIERVLIKKEVKEKVCKICLINYDISNFRKRKVHEAYCRRCEYLYSTARIALKRTSIEFDRSLLLNLEFITEVKNIKEINKYNRNIDLILADFVKNYTIKKVLIL